MESTWPLEVDAELCVGGAPIGERLPRFVRLVAQSRGVREASAWTHGGGRHVRAGIALRAADLPTAVERAASVAQRCALDAGLGAVVVVAVRVAAPGAAERGLRAG